MKIAEISIKRPTLVIVLFTILTLGGLLSYNLLNYELLPKFSPTVVSVTTIYPGASPNEVENTVTKKIEDAVSSMENIKKLEAKSYESISLVTITLRDGTDVNEALNDAQRKVNAIMSQLPNDVDPPSLNKFSIDDLPVMTLGATGKISEAEFYDILDKRVAPILSRVSGVAKVNLIGGQEREIQVNLDATKMEAYKLSLSKVQNIILTSNLDFPTGSVQTLEKDILIRLAGKYNTVEELRNLIISNKNGIQIRLRDIADVQDAQKTVEKLARVNSQSAITLQIIKQSDANAVSVSKDITATVAKLQKDYANIGLSIEIANDSSVYTLQSADAVIHDLFLAIILVAVVMLFFLHSIRNALIVMVAIPASLIATFIFMNLLGYSLNLMSLLALSLVVGILVDDAIVVLENIYRHMEMGKNRVRAAYEATKEIGFTVTSITLVIVVVFIPISLSSGLAANILRQFCVTVSIATLLSLVSSFTIVPWLSSRFSKLEKITGRNFFGKIIVGFEKGLTSFTDIITNILKWCLGHKFITLAGMLLLFFGSFYLVGAGYIGAEFFAKSDRGEFLVQIELPKDASIEKTNEMVYKAEELLKQKPEITKIISTVGQSSDGGTLAALSTAYKAEINVQLVPKAEREDPSNIYAVKIKRELQKVLVGAKVKTVPISILGIAEQAPLALVVTGPSLDSVLVFANAALEELRTVPGASEMKLSVEAGNPEIKVQVDRDKMSSLGLTIGTVGAVMQTSFNGNTDGKFRQGEYEYDINIKYDQYYRQSIDDVKNILFVNDKDEQIRLSQFATVVESSGPSQLERRDKSTAVMVQSQVVGRPSGTVAADWQAKFDLIKRPVGVNYIWAGDMENQSEGFGSLGIALLAAIILVYLIMVALYDSFVYPFVVLFSIPLAIIGAFLALALTNNSLNLFTILGLIMLIGLVAKNAIILVDFTNQRKAEGESTYQALIDANHARLRPILMTTIAMVIGMLPIALASGAGAEWKNGLAWVIIGGLISSLFLTLVIVPVMYAVFDKIINKFSRNKQEKTISEQMVEEYTPLEPSGMH